MSTNPISATTPAPDRRAPVPDAPVRSDRRRFLQYSGLTLGWLALGCDDGGIMAAPPPSPKSPIPVVPTADMIVRTELSAPVGVRSANGELLAYIDDDSIYLWPAGGPRPGPRFIATNSNIRPSGGYGFQMDRPAGSNSPLATLFSIDGQPTWEIGLDMGDDASGQGLGPDLVLAYDSSYPPGDRFRMAPGGYTIHSPTAGSPGLTNRFHVVGGNAEVDSARNVLYVQSGSWQNPGVAEWLIVGQGYHADEQRWGREVFGISVDGEFHGKGVVVAVSGGSERDLISLVTSDGQDRGWLCWRQGSVDWRMGLSGTDRRLSLVHGAAQRFAFDADGSVYADEGLYTFSPRPPLPAAKMTARQWCYWAFEDAAKPIKPYDGVPTESHPAVMEKARASGRSPEEVATEEHAVYGKDVAKVAIGTSRWAKEVQSALERAKSFAEFRRLLGIS